MAEKERIGNAGDGRRQGQNEMVIGKGNGLSSRVRRGDSEILFGGERNEH